MSEIKRIVSIQNKKYINSSMVNFIYSLEPEKRLLQNYKKVLRLIQKDAFWNNIGEAFEKTYPGIKEYLKDHMKDLEKLDCGIVVAGNGF